MSPGKKSPAVTVFTVTPTLASTPELMVAGTENVNVAPAGISGTTTDVLDEAGQAAPAEAEQEMEPDATRPELSVWVSCTLRAGPGPLLVTVVEKTTWLPAVIGPVGPLAVVLTLFV